MPYQSALLLISHEYQVSDIYFITFTLIKKYKKYMALLLKCSNFYVAFLKRFVTAAILSYCRKSFQNTQQGWFFSIRTLKQENINLISLFLLTLFQTLCLSVSHTITLQVHTHREKHPLKVSEMLYFSGRMKMSVQQGDLDSHVKKPGLSVF